MSTPWPRRFSQFEEAGDQTLSNVFVSDVMFVFHYWTLVQAASDCRYALSSGYSQTAEDILLYVKVKASTLLNQAAVLARDATQSEQLFQVLATCISPRSIISSVWLVLAPSKGSQRQAQCIHPPPTSCDGGVARRRIRPKVSGLLPSA